jgi:signal transduction histidine kinase/CheY-like chemotaxis protein
MTLPAAKSVRLLMMDIRLEPDVVLCRQRGRQFAEALGFPPREQIRIATALSEIARNAFRYAGGARVEYTFQSEPREGRPKQPRQSLNIAVRDTGPGISRLDEIMSGQYQSKTGLGLGILGAHRLMDRVNISTSAAGTEIILQKILPPTAKLIEPAEAQRLVGELIQKPPASGMEEMQLQNQELMHAIDEARQREEEIGRINRELAETNTGVLALYDELETLHRVSILMASKLELNQLIQSIIDVTTDLTGAEVGAFYFRAEEGDQWTLQAAAGEAAPTLLGLGKAFGADFLGPDFSSAELLRLPDLEAHTEPCCASQFAKTLEPHFHVRSCLTVPIAAPGEELLGVMIFAVSVPNHFTERSERIVSSIAAQAVIGIEKSRLFQTVRASSEAKDQFLAMLSHELRTPLNPVLAIVTSWQDDPRLGEDLQEEIATIIRNVRLETRLIDDLLDFNKLMNNKLQVDHTPIDMHALIEGVITICREDIDQGRLHVVVDFSAEHFHITGDAARLQQVLWNVLKNAIKFTPSDGRITISTSNPASALLRIGVRDTGRGIDAGALERIFGAFEQGQPQVLARFGGLGLGLAIAKSFVNRHGGKISATSPGLGQGAEIAIELPISETGVLSPDVSFIPPDQPAMSDQAARILLVEDHIDTLNTLARLLARRGHEVITASTANAALQLCSGGGDFNLIISDLGLPDSTGQDLLRRLRAVRPHTPAIALSGYGMDADVTSSKAAGFDEHLTKPIDFALLLRTVNHLTSVQSTTREK